MARPNCGMALLNIREYATMAQVIGGAPMAQEPALARQNVSIGGGSTPSNPFNVLTRYVRVETDAICRIEFGQAPTADGLSARMAANQTEYFAVPEGGGYAVAVISST